jgi:DNA-binding MurR/RpiR family transcriptional regulator
LERLCSALNDDFGATRSRKELTAMIDAAKAKGVPVLLLTPTGDTRAKMADPTTLSCNRP